MINGKKIGLVLSGGGSKGFAHIGVIKVLEANGIRPDIVVGTSMGSTIGGIYASGMSVEKMEKAARNFKANDIVDVNLFNWIRQGVVIGNKFVKYMDKLTNNAKIEDFPIKYACVGCDLITGKQVVFDKGKFSIATRVSSSIPGIFSPYKKDGMLLVDGGVINNNPTELAYEMGAEYVIDVDCVGKAYLLKDIKSITDILMSSFSLTQHLYNKKCKKHSDAKIVINNYTHGYLERNKEAIIDIIHSGEIAAMKKIERIKQDLGIK